MVRMIKLLDSWEIMERRELEFDFLSRLEHLYSKAPWLRSGFLQPAPQRSRLQEGVDGPRPASYRRLRTPTLSKAERTTAARLRAEWTLYSSQPSSVGLSLSSTSASSSALSYASLPSPASTPRRSNPAKPPFYLPAELLVLMFSYCDAPTLGAAAAINSQWNRCTETPSLWNTLLEFYRRQPVAHPPVCLSVAPPKPAVILSFFSTRISVNEGTLLITRRFSTVSPGGGGTCPPSQSLPTPPTTSTPIATTHPVMGAAGSSWPSSTSPFSPLSTPVAATSSSSSTVPTTPMSIPSFRRRPRSSITAEELLHDVSCFFRIHPKHLHLRVFTATANEPISVRVDPQLLDVAMRTQNIGLCTICRAYYYLHPYFRGMGDISSGKSGKNHQRPPLSQENDEDGTTTCNGRIGATAGGHFIYAH